MAALTVLTFLMPSRLQSITDGTVIRVAAVFVCSGSLCECLVKHGIVSVVVGWVFRNVRCHTTFKGETGNYDIILVFLTSGKIFWV